MMYKSNEGLQKLFFILCTDFTFLIYRSCIVFSIDISFECDHIVVEYFLYVDMKLSL